MLSYELAVVQHGSWHSSLCLCLSLHVLRCSRYNARLERSFERRVLTSLGLSRIRDNASHHPLGVLMAFVRVENSLSEILFEALQTMLSRLEIKHAANGCARGGHTARRRRASVHSSPHLSRVTIT